ncbi:unnamed protein product [Ixodes hexagonus]
MQSSWKRTVSGWSLPVGCFVLLAVVEISRCYATDPLLLSEDVRAQVRKLSKEHSEVSETLEREIAELVRQVKLNSPGARKEELTVQLKGKQQLLKTKRDEFRRKLQELIGDPPAETAPPDIADELESMNLTAA